MTPRPIAVRPIRIDSHNPNDPPMDTIALAHDSTAAPAKYPHQLLMKRCVGCGESMRDCGCYGCNCATCATKHELKLAELDCGGCHLTKKDCTCGKTRSDIRSPKPNDSNQRMVGP
jgi:hypothetical protein